MRFTTVLRAAATAGGISLLAACATSPIGSGEASMCHNPCSAISADRENSHLEHFIGVAAVNSPFGEVTRWSRVAISDGHSELSPIRFPPLLTK